MSNSLREKLLGLGFTAPAPEPKPEHKPDGAPRGDRRPGGEHRGGGKPGEHRGERGPRPPGEPRRDGRPPGSGKPGEPRRDGRPASAARSGEPRRDGRPASAGNPGAPRRDARPGNAADPANAAKPGEVRPAGPRRAAKPRSREEMDLAKAYAIRAQREKQERIEAERIKQEEARLRREAKAKVAELVKDKALNAKDAEIARHFPYGSKIKRIHVTPDQLKALNAGELGVLQLDGRYLLVTAALLDEAGAIFPPAVALRVDPDAPVGDDPYADPAYQVPDDLVW